VAKGYTVQWSKTAPEPLHLEHPNRDAPDLMLLSDGTVDVLRFPQREENWIAADEKADESHFNSFLAGVPEPTMLQSFKSMTVPETSAAMNSFSAKRLNTISTNTLNTIARKIATVWASMPSLGLLGIAGILLELVPPRLLTVIDNNNEESLRRQRKQKLKGSY
jgi:hypothetical protein